MQLEQTKAKCTRNEVFVVKPETVQYPHIFHMCIDIYHHLEKDQVFFSQNTKYGHIIQHIRNETGKYACMNLLNLSTQLLHATFFWKRLHISLLSFNICIIFVSSSAVVQICFAQN